MWLQESGSATVILSLCCGSILGDSAKLPRREGLTLIVNEDLYKQKATVCLFQQFHSGKMQAQSHNAITFVGICVPTGDAAC